MVKIAFINLLIGVLFVYININPSSSISDGHNTMCPQVRIIEGSIIIDQVKTEPYIVEANGLTREGIGGLPPGKWYGLVTVTAGGCTVKMASEHTLCDPCTLCLRNTFIIECFPITISIGAGFIFSIFIIIVLSVILCRLRILKHRMVPIKLASENEPDVINDTHPILQWIRNHVPWTPQSSTGSYPKKQPDIEMRPLQTFLPPVQENRALTPIIYPEDSISQISGRSHRSNRSRTPSQRSLPPPPLYSRPYQSTRRGPTITEISAGSSSHATHPRPNNSRRNASRSRHQRTPSEVAKAVALGTLFLSGGNACDDTMVIGDTMVNCNEGSCSTYRDISSSIMSRGEVCFKPEKGHLDESISLISTTESVIYYPIYRTASFTTNIIHKANCESAYICSRENCK